MTSEPESQRPVLFAYDGSGFAKVAIEEAGRELPDGRAALVLTIWQPLDSIPFLGAPFAVIPQEFAEGVEKRAGEIAAEGAELAREAGFVAEPLVSEGLPVWRRVVDVAEERDAGLIVLGSHGRTGADYVLLGSVATAVAQHSKRPVLIVHV